MAAAAVLSQNSNGTTACQVISHDKIFQKIQEVLPDCIASDDIDSFLEIFDGKVSEPIKVYVETAVRYYVMQNLCRGADTDLSKITAVAKLSTGLTRKEVSLPTLPMLILSDAFDSLTVQQCEKLFSFVESNVTIWKETIFFAPSKNQVLRMCNDVLRRLSRSQNTIFCGRILLFLARFFPFSERSGLNLISEFNLENITTFSSNGDTAEDEGMEVTEVKDETDEEAKEGVKDDKEGKDTKPSLDHTLYTKFWALQDFFRNPIQCYQKAPWAKFTAYASDVMEAFSSFKLDCDTTVIKRSPITYPDVATDGEELDQTIVDCLPNVNKVDQYFAKFLTNQRLLDLQFSDSNFRRYVLVQLLILCHYLTAVIKFKQEALSATQVSWVRVTEEKVFALLRETPPDGDQFVAIIGKILKREDLWNDWKNNGCPEIKKPAMTEANVTVNGKEEGDEDDDKNTPRRGRKRRLGDQVRDADAKKKFSMANAEMTRLWNLCPDNVEATLQSKRDFIPSLEQYFTRAVEQLTAAKDLPESDKLVLDGNFGWRGLRILACRSPHFFTHSTAPIATLPEYLTTMIKKLAKDMPQLNGRQPQADDPKQEEEKMIPDQAEEEAPDEMEEEEGPSREDLLPLTAEEQDKIATNLATIAPNTWRNLTKKLGFQDDEVDYILEQKGGSVKDCTAHFLQLWVENEGDEGNKDTIVYTLEGLKMPEVVNGVFQ